MIRGINSVLLFSENANKLAEFYNEKVGLKISFEGEMGEGKEAGEVYEFSFGNGTSFTVLDHQKVKGKNKLPERFMINFEVDNIEEEVKKLDKNKVKKIQDIYHIEEYGYVATFIDIDGNYFQLVQVRSNRKK